jgi:exosortase E/protease (VPEID-CTERM system)
LRGSASYTWHSLRPLISLAILFAAELLLLTVWLDTATLAAGSPLLHTIGVYGSPILRAAVVFGLVSVTLAYLKIGASAPAEPVIAWRFLAGHFAAMGVFAGLSSLLFAHKAGDFTAVSWLAAGLAAIALGALAFIPAAAWWRMIRGMGVLWIFAVLAGASVSFAGTLAARAWAPLGQLTIHLVVAVLRLFVSPVSMDAARHIIATPHFEVEVSAACSGFEGMGLMLVFGVVWLYLFRAEYRFPRALVLVPAGIVFIYLLNIVRIVALLLIGNAGAPDIAVGGFHSQAGWLAFTAAALGFSMVARRNPWLAAGAVAASPPLEAEANPTTAYLLPFLAILAAGMLSNAASARFEWFYGLRFVAACAALLAYRNCYRTLDWRFSWLGLSAGVLVFAIWIGLDRLRGVTGSESMPAALLAAPLALRTSWILVRALAATVTVPIAEELAFRGFLLRRLVSADFEKVAWNAVPWTALLLSSLPFGLMHGQRWFGGILAGLVYGYLAIRRGSIGEAAAAHATTNALIAIYVLTGNQWQLW